MKKTALITGITGQDGSYLAELLLSKGYRVAGLSRQRNPAVIANLRAVHDKIEYIFGDLRDQAILAQTIEKIQPHEIYNLASQSYPGKSWNTPLETAELNGFCAHQLFETIRLLKPDCRIYQASSSEMYGKITNAPQNEQTPFHPTNPYAAAKNYAHQMAVIYRNNHTMFISCGILFNHESPRRGINYITQKVTYAAACLKRKIYTSPLLNEQHEPILLDKVLSLGNLDARRDWGYAGDYVEAMWLMLQQPTPDDFVIGTGIAHSIKELCQTAFSYVGLNWQDHVKMDPRFIRPAETGTTIADATKANLGLNWKPKMSFQTLISNMIEAHLEKI